MIDIKDVQGNIIVSVPVTDSAQKVEELMSNDYIQLSWNRNSSNSLPLGSYIEHEGERYSLLEPYTPSQKNEVEFVYTPQFKSRVMAWGKMPFFFYSGESREPDWTLTSNPADFMRCVCDAILKETGEEWSYSIDASLSSSASLSFTSVDILSGLNQIADAFETEWLADKSTNTIYLGLLSHGESVELEVGSNINIPSVQGSREGYYTRFYAFGSTRNITQDYEGSNTNNLVNKRLTLDPAKYPNGYKDIREDLNEGEIFSKVLIFDDVYPSEDLSISGVRNRLMYRLDSNGDKIQVGTDDEGKPIYDQYAIWYFRIEGFDFDVSNIIEGYNLSVSFQSGALQGREFELKYYEKNTTIMSSDGLTFEAKAGDYEILFVEEGSLIIPSLTGLAPSDGDEVILFNIKMPSEYTQSAYDKLEERLDKEIARMSSDLNNYTFKSNPVAFNENNPNLTIGRSVKFVNGDYSYNTRVIKLTTHLDFPIEQEITIGNEKVKGNTQQLKEEVANANKDLNLLAVFNDMTQSIQQSYARTQQMMLEGFAAIKNIWQLKTDENGNTYAFSAFDVVSQKGITMYADGALLNIPSIYAGLPIDNTTIYWDNGVLKAKGGTEGAITSVTKDMVISALGYTPYNASNPSGYITSSALTGYATQSWVEGKGYALSSDLDAISSKLNSFLEGSDTDNIINKWLELEAFLSGLSESDNLATILEGKVDRIYVDSNFVSINTAQSILGEKNFTGGLKVNGSPIYYDATNKYWKLEGDLLVTGGITMYGSESSFTPSTIMDAIAVDGITISKDGGVLKVIGDLGGGATTLGGLSNVGTWADSVADVDRIMYQAAGSSNWVAKSLSSIGGGVSGDYLPLTGGTLSNKLNIHNTSYVRNLIDLYAPYTDGAYITCRDESRTVNVGLGVQGALLDYINGSEFSSLTLNPESITLTTNSGANTYTLLHSGNYSSYALPLTGGTILGDIYFGERSTSVNKTGTGTTLPSHLYRNVYDTTGSVYDHYYNNGYTASPYTTANLRVKNGSSYRTLLISGDGRLLWENATIWHSGNDGSGSGLDADLLDGLHSNKFMTHANDWSTTTDIAGIKVFGYAGPSSGFYGTWGAGIQLCNNAAIVNNAPPSSNNDNANWYSQLLFGTDSRVYVRFNTNGGGWSSQKQIAYTSDNVASATKLQTARKIWGQSFDGTNAIYGDLHLTAEENGYGNSAAGKLHFSGNLRGNYGVYLSATHVASYGRKRFGIFTTNAESDTPSWVEAFSVTPSGYVGIGTTNPEAKLTIHGGAISGNAWASDYGQLIVRQGTYASNSYALGLASNTSGYCEIQAASQGIGAIPLVLQKLAGNVGIGVVNPSQKLHVAGNILTTGGITMYSDQRKKTILGNVELSLKQIANAPLVEHYYNGDEKKTTHVGSIAQYWAGLNDWFCKLDNEGFYTMEIQNAALASAISVARELDRYETKTDKTIKKLKKRICQLEDELERLKSA